MSSLFRTWHPRRNTTYDRKRRDFNRVMAETSEAASAKWPDVALEEEAAGDIVRADKSFTMPIDIRKADPDQHLIFGWAYVSEKDGKAVIDHQGDIIPVEELENAAYEFNINSRSGGDMHAKKNVAKLVESVVFTKEKQAALGIDLGQVGWWVGFKVHDEDVWAAHKRGERPEFSIGGAAIHEEVA
jgi:hypothetical protein